MCICYFYYIVVWVIYYFRNVVFATAENKFQKNIRIIFQLFLLFQIFFMVLVLFNINNAGPDVPSYQSMQDFKINESQSFS